MKKEIFGLGMLVLLLLTACHTNKPAGEWKLVWEDNFDQATGLDTASWSKIPRGKPEWAKFMSDADTCYEVSGGNLILKGMINLDRSVDTATYITGGVYTKYKRPFHGGRLEIKAKLQGAKGAWPAIWLKPFEESKYPWPTGGEIDIMEHLNHDSIVYQTVHSYYTHHLNLKKDPPQGGTAPIDPEGYNVYAVEMYPDSIVYFVNNIRNFAYPRIETDKEGQFPFDKPYYLLIDMQLGGPWVGSIGPEELPVEMKVDWVRYYQKE